MKLIKCIIKKNRTSDATNFEYPPKWDAQKLNVVAYEDTDTIGEVEEYAVGIIHDDGYADELIASSEQITEIDEDEANRLGSMARPQRLMIDEEKLAEIVLVVDKPKNSRTEEENRMLNPEDSMPGIRRTSGFNIRNWFPDDKKNIPKIIKRA